MITSNKNKKVKNLISLIKKRKNRDDLGVYIVEGPKMFSEAHFSEIIEIYFSKSFYESEFENDTDLENSLKQRNIDTQIVEILSDEVFKNVSGTDTPQGVLAVLRQKEYELEDLLKDNNPLILILENLQDPGNMGTMLRTGEAAGISGMLISKNSVDIYNPKTIRSTMGSIFRVPFVYSKDILRDVNILKDKGINIYCAHLKAENFYDEKDYKKPTAFVIGNESKGISDKLSNEINNYIKIPMSGKVESLNAAQAAGILMYEAKRQRR
ncbi:TrmH family RNA methyltransferase [Acetitomaculum ruminis]|uniref:TrmH family RNA methyltransferase n=1 Tax=Acetitomaculum ruminis TaxID=2382 RepID=UPI000B8177A3